MWLWKVSSLVAVWDCTHLPSLSRTFLYGCARWEDRYVNNWCSIFGTRHSCCASAPCRTYRRLQQKARRQLTVSGTTPCVRNVSRGNEHILRTNTQWYCCKTYIHRGGRWQHYNSLRFLCEITTFSLSLFLDNRFSLVYWYVSLSLFYGMSDF